MIFLQNIINSFKRPRHSRQPPYVRVLEAIRAVRKPFPRENFTENFYINLKKTIVWTQNIVESIKDPAAIDYVHVLRSVNPMYEGKPFYRFTETTAIPANIYFDYEDVLSEALSIRPGVDLPLETIIGLGRILRFEINITIKDGAPCAENGLVDESDIPPIDTWFHISKKYLYCWIPNLFIGKMEDVIAVEMLGSYEWIELNATIY